MQSREGKKIEPWYIATDLENLDKVYGYCERRIWIEEMLRDFKWVPVSHSFIDNPLKIT